jgi:polygalacturonase
LKLKTIISYIGFITTLGFTQPTLNILDYGAINDGKTLNTKVIQQAIDACSNAGNGTVYFPAGRYVSGTLYLKSNVTLYLDQNAVLLGSTDLDDYPQTIPDYRSYTDNYTIRSLIYAEKQHNIKITGQGTIDGQGQLFPPERHPYHKRPFMIRMIECENIAIENVTIQNSSMWVQHYLACTHLDITGITVKSRGANFNNDGLDIDGCHHVRISDCFIDSEDDAIVLKSTSERACENVSISHCTLTTLSNAIKCGTESVGGFKNIRISDCHIYDNFKSGIALEIVDGGVMDGVLIDNITMDNVNHPIFIRLGNRARPYTENAPKPGVGTMKNITITNVVANRIGRFMEHDHAYRTLRFKFDHHVPASITGLPGHAPENITLSNISIQYTGSSPYLDPGMEVPEAETLYPEFDVFGQLPAAGLFCRHVKNLTLENINLSFIEPDERVSLYCEDVQGLFLSNLKENSTALESSKQFFKEVKMID